MLNSGLISLRQNVKLNEVFEQKKDSKFFTHYLLIFLLIFVKHLLRQRKIKVISYFSANFVQKQQ